VFLWLWEEVGALIEGHGKLITVLEVCSWSALVERPAHDRAPPAPSDVAVVRGQGVPRIPTTVMLVERFQGDKP
jgi:hypothetical protein